MPPEGPRVFTPIMESPTLTRNAFAHYELIEEIGRGGMGAVYRARDTKLGRQVAIKVLPITVAADPERRARFLREARAAARLNHPAIATVYEVGEARVEDPAVLGETGADAGPREVIYLAMELVEGQDLGPLLERGLTLKQTLDYGIQMAEGLAAAHRKGVIHRDLKPGNVRITPEGKVKILDFGLAKLVAAEETPADPTLTLRGGIVGSAPYMAPEQVEGAGVDERTDLFSFGVVLYQMLTGRTPWPAGRLIDYVKALARERPEPASRSNPEVSPRLEGLVERLLARDPGERYPSAVTVGEELKAIARSRTGESSAPPRDSVFSVVRGPLAGSRLVWAALITALLAVAAGTVLWRSGAPASLPVKSLAVLPFENRTDDPALDAYYEGVGLTLARKLSKVEGIDVVSELEVRPYRDTRSPPLRIARELGVGTLLLGDVQGGAERIRIAVQLVDAATGAPVWDFEIGGEAAELLELQERLADEVIRQLGVSVSERERRRLRLNPTASVEAFAAYFEGVALLDLADLTAVDRAVARFRRAIEADPEFAWAHGGLSEALLRRHDQAREPELLEQAAAAADRALELDPTQPALLVARARVHRQQGHHEEALADLETARQLNPGLDLVHKELGQTYKAMSRLDLAEISYRQAVALRPLSWRNWNQLGAFLMGNEQPEPAREALQQAARLAPKEVAWPLENLGTLALLEGDYGAALEAYERIPAFRRTASLLTNMGSLAFALGHLERAESHFRAALELQPAEPVHWLNLGDTQLRRGEEGEARASYRRGLEEAEEQVAQNPREVRLLTLRVLLLAKAGECSRAVPAAMELRDGLEGDLRALTRLLKALAVCRQKVLTLDLAGELLAAGTPPERLRQEPELGWLAGDPALEALLRGATERLEPLPAR